MRFRLGRRGDYAVRAVLQLARHWGDRRQKSREIAEAMAIPENFLPQILGSLVRGGLVTSQAGPDGGYALARPPHEVTMLEVVESVDETPSDSECVLRGGPCHWVNRCAVHEPWSRAQQALFDELERTTFAELVKADEELERAAEA